MDNNAVHEKPIHFKLIIILLILILGGSAFYFYNRKREEQLLMNDIIKYTQDLGVADDFNIDTSSIDEQTEYNFKSI